MRINQIISKKPEIPWQIPLKLGLAVVLICLIAPVKISLASDIPITLQTLIILSSGMILGANLGAIAVALYLLAGALGLPVFANGGSGWAHLFGPTGGFLFSFIPAAYLVGKMAEGLWAKKWWNIAFNFLTGHILILLIGFVWLGFFRGFTGLLEKVYPLIPGMYVKILIGTLFVYGTNKLLERLEST